MPNFAGPVTLIINIFIHSYICISKLASKRSYVHVPCNPLHLTAASSAWLQDLVILIPRCPQLIIIDSLPLHRTLSNKISPDPLPKPADPMAVPDDPNPSCLHTTPASESSHPSSHTVPHSSL